MSRRTDAGQPVPTTGQHAHVVNGTTLRQALAWISDAGLFDHLQLPGHTKWQPVNLVGLAVLGVWSESATRTGAFAAALRWTLDLFGTAAVHRYQGLTGALATWSAQLVPLRQQRLQAGMRECGHECWRIGRWLALAVDGSRVRTPRTVAHEQAFCARARAKARRPSTARRSTAPGVAAGVRPHR